MNQTDLTHSREQLRAFVLENYLFTDDQTALNDADSFLENNILDSTGIMEIIFYLEEHFSIVVTEDEMVPNNLDSIDNLVAYMAGKVDQ